MNHPLPGAGQGDVGVSATAGRYVSRSTGADEELRAVLAVSQALAGKLDVENVLAVAIDTVAEVAGAEGASILLIDPQTGGMTFHVAAGPCAGAAKSVPLPPGAGICGHVARSGKPLIVNDAQNDPRFFSGVDRATGQATRNLLCTCLRSAGNLWGVLELINKSGPEGFDAGDLRVAEAVAPMIALSLENAHHHAEALRNERMVAVGQTVSGLAHCIKNVLNGIRAGSSVVDRSLREEDFQRLESGWKVVRRNNDMLSNLVLDMLSLAREARFHPFPTDVNDLAEQICNLMEERAGQRGITVTCTAAENLPEVVTDPTQYYRCLLNLVSNAVDAAPDGGNVHVRVCRAANKSRFTTSVTDNGGGIQPEHRSKVFGDFFTTKGNQGTGLGLPVTRKLITAMGGTITFHSVVGRGTRFVMALPVDHAPEETQT